MSNPWETGTEYDGHRPAYCSTEDRSSRVQTMTPAELAAALEWPDTQKTVRAKIERRLREMRNVGVAEPKTKMGPADRRAAKRAASLWIKPCDEMPDGDMMVMLRVDDKLYEAYATAGYWSGSSWREAIGALPIRHVCGWMEMHDALAALAKTRGEVAP